MDKESELIWEAYTNINESRFSPEQKKKLRDLIDIYYSETDPNNPDDEDSSVLDTIRSEFGDKIADELYQGSYKMHFGRDDVSYGRDPLDKPSPRITSSGKMYKQDTQERIHKLRSRFK